MGAAMAVLQTVFIQSPEPAIAWVLVKEFNFSYDNKETELFTIDPNYG